MTRTVNKVRLIDADALRRWMYHGAFEVDSGMQKWDSGLWIRYKMFENGIESAPTIDAVPVVRCGECRFFISDDAVCKLDNQVWDKNAYCSYGERREDGDGSG